MHTHSERLIRLHLITELNERTAADGTRWHSCRSHRQLCRRRRPKAHRRGSAPCPACAPGNKDVNPGLRLRLELKMRFMRGLSPSLKKNDFRPEIKTRSKVFENKTNTCLCITAQVECTEMTWSQLCSAALRLLVDLTWCNVDMSWRPWGLTWLVSDRLEVWLGFALEK